MSQGRAAVFEEPIGPPGVRLKQRPQTEPAAGAAVLACPPENVARLGSKGFVQIGEVR